MEERKGHLTSTRACKSSRVAIKLLCSILVRKGNSLMASLLSSPASSCCRDVFLSFFYLLKIKIHVNMLYIVR